MNTYFQKLILCVLASLFGLFLLGNFYTHSTAAPLTDGIPPFPNTVEVKVYELRSDGSKTDTLCTPASTNYGCTAFCNTPNNTQCSPTIYPVEHYPYTTSTISVPVETYYLLDVVSQEMNPAIYGEQVALHAQAIAARSYMGWHLNNPDINNPIPYNNSNGFQVFVPYKFDSLNPSAEPLEPNTIDPCAAGSLNHHQQQVCNAIASHNYIALAENNPDHRPAFAEFFSDVQTETKNHPEVTRFSYLSGVDEPISTACDSNDNGMNYAGMSQEGAVRWTKGNQCAGSGDQPWPVRWTDYRQILAHYYTGIDFLNGSGAKFAPDYRWNLLHHDAPQEMPAGQMRKITLHIQNTSAFDWDETVSLRWKLASACRTADAVVSWNHKALDPSPEKWKKGADQFVEIDVYSPRGSR